MLLQNTNGLTQDLSGHQESDAQADRGADGITIKTSDPEWVLAALKCYTEKRAFDFEDDEGLGLTAGDLESAVSLLRAARFRGRIGAKTIVSALAGVGVTGVGVWIILAAIADPEPTSKLGLLIAGGLLLALTGSLGTLAACGVKFSVSAKTRGGSFTIDPK